jgi:LysR family transcriptional regulator, mexEF-oprN operon transcriptional activator
MLVISVVDLRRLDLNLLVVFHVMMEERHVTRAAAKLHLSQGAVSASLARLRLLFDDPLFQRTRGGMVPTPKALALAPKIGQSLAMFDDLIFEATDFDPATSRRTFHLAMSDDLEAVLVPRLLQEVRRNGWSVSFSFHQTNSLLWQEALDDPRMDLVVCSSPAQVPASYQQSVLFTSSYSCLYDRTRSHLSQPLTVAEYLESGHVRVSYNAQRGFVDGYFEAQGRERKAVVSISHFAGVIPALRVGNVIATIPSYTARAFAESAGLAISPPPIPVPRFAISLLWKVPQEAQPEHVWLRGLLEDWADVYSSADRVEGVREEAG